MGWGCYNVRTFLRPRSLDLSQDVDATLTWGGVGWDDNVPSTTFHLSQDLDATLTWGGVGWGRVGWGDGNAHLMLRPR